MDGGRASESIASPSLQRFFDNTVLLIDPYTENPFYEFSDTLEKMEESYAIPAAYKSLVGEYSIKKKFGNLDDAELERWKERKYVEFWLDLKADPSKRAKFAQEFMDSESQRGANVGIPPCP